MRDMGFVQAIALVLLLASAALPNAAADGRSQLRGLKQFGGGRSPLHDESHAVVLYTVLHCNFCQCTLMRTGCQSVE